MKAARLHGYVTTRLLDGTWRYVHAMVDPRPHHRRGDDDRFFKLTLDFVPGMSRFKSRARVVRERSILAAMPPNGGINDNGDVKFYEMDAAPVPHLLHACEDACPEGLWWSSPRGALERPVTIYEYMHRAELPPPRADWTIVDGAKRAAVLKEAGRRALSSEMDDDVRREKREAVAANVDKARRLLAHHKKGLALKKTLVERWRKKLARFEKRLATLNDVERTTHKGDE